MTFRALSLDGGLVLVMVLVMAVARFAHADEALTVFHDLDEATARIARLGDKPYDKLIDAGGFYQSETLIFQDTVSGHEVWSLTMEQAVDLANIERRGNWSADGSVFSMKSNRVFRRQDGEMHHTNWSGHSFLMEADLTNRRKLWAVHEEAVLASNDKFDTWSNVTRRTLYYIEAEHLYRIDVGYGKENAATRLYTFPDDRRRILQNISDNDMLLIQDENGSQPSDAPLFYVIDATLDPTAPNFVRSRSFNLGGLEGIDGHDPQNEYHVHAMSIDRAGTQVGWNYGPSTSVGEYVHFTLSLDDFDETPEWRDSQSDPYGQYMSHSGKGPDGRVAYFGGPVKLPDGTRDPDLNPHIPLGWGIWVREEGREGEPMWIGGPAPGGHAQWGGQRSRLVHRAHIESMAR